MVQTQTSNTKNASGNKKWFLMIGSLFAILLLIAGCQDEQPDAEQGVSTATAVATQISADETAVPTEEAAVPEIANNPAIAGAFAINSQEPVNVTALAAADLAAANIEPMPTGVRLISDVFAVDSSDSPISGEVIINVPADAEATLLDLYGWNGTSWVFVPSEYDPAQQQRQSVSHTLYQAFALGQAELPNPITQGGVWSESVDSSAEQLTEAVVSTLYLSANGELEGSLSDIPAEVAHPYLQLSNVSDDAIDEDTLAALLADESAQTAHIEAIIDSAAPFAGVNLNYQGVDASQKEAFTVFVQNLSDALDAHEKNLILTLAVAQQEDVRNDLGGFNWIALGTIADGIYLQLPLDPNGYEEAGMVDQILSSVTEAIDRRKLVALISTSAVVHSGDTWGLLPADEQLLHFGELILADDAAAREPETAVEAALSGEISPIQWNEVSSTYYYTVDDGTQVWLGHPTTTAQRMETVLNHNLQGVAFTTATQLPDSAQTEAPAIVWTILDNDGNTIVTEASPETSFLWEGAAEPGEFTLNVDFVSGDQTTALGSLPISVTAVAETEEEAESDESTERITGILKQNANVRIGPGESYEKFPNPLLKDTEVELIGRDEFGYWLHIAFSNIDGEQTGWIATSLVEVDPEFDIETLADASDILSTPAESTIAEAPSSPTEPSPEATTAAAAPPPSSGPPPPVSAPPVAVGGFELGGQTHSFANPALMASAGMTWVKFQHKWGSGSNPNELAGRINNAHGAGFKVLLSIPGANTYPESINFEEYVQFLAGVAALGPDAIEVWNEMNIDFEWPAGQIDPNSYVNNMLAPAYNAIKAANPNVMVISGAPAPTGFDNNTNAWADNRYMAGMLAAGAGRYADCIGAHYNAGASSPSSNSGHPTGSAHYSWYLLPTLNVYAQLGKPVCFTELGYLSGDDYGGVPERFAWAAQTSVDEHAAWLAEAVSVAANTGKVRMVIVFNVDFTHWGDDPQAGYAMIRANGGCPACDTLARVMGR